MEVVLARLDAVRRRGKEAMPALRAAFAAATATIQVPVAKTVACLPPLQAAPLRICDNLQSLIGCLLHARYGQTNSAFRSSFHPPLAGPDANACAYTCTVFNALP